MSKERRIIEIEPRLLISGGRMSEQVESNGHKCQYCQGNGYLWQVDDPWQERYKMECPICKGSGKLDAVVTIEWKASEKQ
ncbi:hypothetical protein HMPREF0663_11884 [Hoylesella oralis ATCC 33269]|uniref:Uncharacterized protein n=1 Tax=Hoylesella oralis ATCC 33269 TaxID=873533 RepID=E7RRT3_9BACT|nr:hypothetical protein [Hoylesella oralis]EFZ36971.1 hypothetical protein HMPREF0663_11884 [Hoylesella oralis ATCC 33269]EPH18686.1 hypothetical protein HMPREF1475_00594 [Hoylesella oralis HGA0225]SHF77882.1 hypothetical protein SAMN05444288_1519 [Hoylesella oralis]